MIPDIDITKIMHIVNNKLDFLQLSVFLLLIG